MSSAATSPVKTQQQYIDDLYALFDTSSYGAILWDKLDRETRTCFCKFAGLTMSHIDLPLKQYNELDRHKLLKAIKSLEQITKTFNKLSLSEFK